MRFNFGFLFTVMKRCVVGTAGTNARLTPKRIIVLVGVSIWYVTTQCINWTCFLIDEILFFRYRKVQIKEPVFIVGIPRSGTTFLHRMIAIDEERFTTIKTWEIALAPSIIQRYFFRLLGLADRLLGKPVYRIITAVESRIMPDLQKMHPFGMFKPEEDEVLLVHCFYSLFLFYCMPFEDLFKPMVYFDERVEANQRKKVMNFYQRMLQKHLFVFGKNKRFLSKNPAFCSKVETLRETFPDCRVINTTRSPLNSVPSLISLFYEVFPVFFSEHKELSLKDFTLDLVHHWYRHPLECLDRWPADRRAIVKYDDLIGNPAAVVTGLYEHFGFVVTPALENQLEAEMQKSKTYKSKHSYTLEQYGLTTEGVVADFKDIFDRFGFYRGATAKADTKTEAKV